MKIDRRTYADHYGPTAGDRIRLAYADQNTSQGTADAMNLLKANGWNVVANGTDTCAKPGTGSGEMWKK